MLCGVQTAVERRPLAPVSLGIGGKPRITMLAALNLDFAEWDQAFPANRLLASATLDRLRHNAYCLVLDGDSYRAPRATAATAKPRAVANGAKTSHP